MRKGVSLFRVYPHRFELTKSFIKETVVDYFPTVDESRSHNFFIGKKERKIGKCRHFIALQYSIHTVSTKQSHYHAALAPSIMIVGAMHPHPKNSLGAVMRPLKYRPGLFFS